MHMWSSSQDQASIREDCTRRSRAKNVGGAIVGSGGTLFVEYTKLEELESYFSENKVVCDHKRFWGRNQHIDRFHRMILINQLLSSPKAHIKRGDVTEAELASIPQSLKRWALWPYTCAMIWFFAAIIWYIWYDW